jgi:hypothetical protein
MGREGLEKVAAPSCAEMYVYTVGNAMFTAEKCNCTCKMQHFLQHKQNLYVMQLAPLIFYCNRCECTYLTQHLLQYTQKLL